jgi:hypothetical protein
MTDTRLRRRLGTSSRNMMRQRFPMSPLRAEARERARPRRLSSTRSKTATTLADLEHTCTPSTSSIRQARIARNQWPEGS